MRRRYRHLLVHLCVLALVFCQVAMAAQLCHGGSVADPADKGATSSGCHDPTPPTGAPDGNDPACPSSKAVPDNGGLPAIAPLPSGHDFFPSLAGADITHSPLHRQPRSRDGPSLASLCRLLI